MSDTSWTIIGVVVAFFLWRNRCWVLKHNPQLRGRYKRWSNADIEYWHCTRCSRYWRKAAVFGGMFRNQTIELDPEDL